ELIEPVLVQLLRQPQPGADRVLLRGLLVAEASRLEELLQPLDIADERQLAVLRHSVNVARLQRRRRQASDRELREDDGDELLIGEGAADTLVLDWLDAG